MLRMLLRSDVAERLGRAYKLGAAPSAKQREEFAAARSARPKLAHTLPGARAMASSDPENYAVVGSVAQITVEGVLSEEPDFWAWLFGMDGTTYEDIRDAFALAASDPLVKSVILSVSSPGGYTDGLFETLAAIEAFGKPITVQASQACSAAYALAAMAGPITALGPASEFGSIGVACSFAFDADTEVVDVTSSAAPNKRPDPRTPEGKAVIVEYLDAIHEIFADAIARGRSSATGKAYTVDQVNADFGRGSTMLADAAKSAGLIDKMPRAAKRAGPNAADEDRDDAGVAPPARAVDLSKLVAGYDAMIAGGFITRDRAATAVAHSVSSKYAKGDRVEALVNHMPGMKGMTGEVEIVRTKPAYYGVKFDGETETHKWLAEDELKAASDDSMASALAPAQPSQPRSTGQEKPKVKPMTEEELLAQHPQLHAAVLAKGATAGQAAERKRVASHFKSAKIHGGKIAGAVEVAVKHIETGASIQDDDVYVEYQEAGVAHRETANRQADSDAAGAALNGAKPPTPQTIDNSDLVAAAIGLAPVKKSA